MISALLGWPTRVPSNDSRLQHSCEASWPSMPEEGSSFWPSLHNLQLCRFWGTPSPVLI